jgi:7-cyano-7-deazaguanine synthase in queuosine biosynthesis
MSLVLWSGGLDSTLILHDLAKEQRDGTLYHPHGIRALTIHHPQVGYHPPTLAASQKKLKDVFRKSGFTINYLDVTLSQSHAGWRSEGFVAGTSFNPQMVLWLTLSAHYLQGNEDLYAGYIRTDDAWHNIGNLWMAFNGLQSLAGRSGTMRFPLEWQRKADVIRRTREHGLYQHCWWCEESDPKKLDKKTKRCGKCTSCMTHDAGEWQLKHYPPE